MFESGVLKNLRDSLSYPETGGDSEVRRSETHRNHFRVNKSNSNRVKGINTDKPSCVPHLSRIVSLEDTTGPGRLVGVGPPRSCHGDGEDSMVGVPPTVEVCRLKTGRVSDGHGNRDGGRRSKGPT